MRWFPQSSSYWPRIATFTSVLSISLAVPTAINHNRDGITSALPLSISDFVNSTSAIASSNSLPQFPARTQWEEMCGEVPGPWHTTRIDDEYRHLIGSLTWETCTHIYHHGFIGIQVPPHAMHSSGQSTYAGSGGNPRVDRGRFHYMSLSCQEPHDVRFGRISIHAQASGQSRTYEFGGYRRTRNPFVWFWQDFPMEQYESQWVAGTWEVEIWGGSQPHVCDLTHDVYTLRSREARPGVLSEGGSPNISSKAL